MPEEDASAAVNPPRRSTGSLKTGTGELQPPRSGAAAAPPRRDISVRVAETIVFLLAVMGAVSIGLGISSYLGQHRYVYAYLVAYAAFRIADLLVREESMLGADRAHFARRIMGEVPVLALFAIAPFERSYYSGDAPSWLAGLGILIELVGMWLALGARVQLGFFNAGADGSPRPPLVRSGLYRHIRHPIYLGEFLVVLAWPFEYGAPLTMIAAVIAGAILIRRRVQEDEAEMLATYGDQYAEYMRTSDAIVPNVW